MVERGDRLEFKPRLPARWESATFRLRRHGSTLQVDLDPSGCTLSLVDGVGVVVGVGEETVVVTADAPLSISSR
jgi:trehalose/maltose hydrolase-like predicted phosphorylase